MTDKGESIGDDEEKSTRVNGEESTKKPTAWSRRTIMFDLPNWKVCRIIEGQRYSTSLSEKQVTSLLKLTCQHPYDRERDIVKAAHHNDYDENPYAKEFGLKISNKLVTIEALILPTPVSYKKGLLLEGYCYPCSFRLKKAFRKIHVRLTMELEKKFRLFKSCIHVYFIDLI
ncbi:hypothetical protein GIB67_041451 [Kingdonia uniflora]|uniref:Argonaute linker 2 domain-containing protein n=1 Tax=Kingdonia uniflora TaxID=39325 RepID=A0A7J7LRI0_9MAGN|nr:hypothetical protein GIB67_041451 [Kingdonia uniflora]